MALSSDLAGLRATIEEHGTNLAYYPSQAVPLILNVLAGLLEATPGSTPIGRVLEAILRALPAGIFAGKEIRRLADSAGRGQEPYLLLPADQVAKAFRTLATTLPSGRTPPRTPAPDPRFRDLRLERQAEKFLSRRRRELVLFLLHREGHAAREREVIAHLWPDERRRKVPSEAARNRLHKLMHDTNEALLELEEASNYQIRRNAGPVLRLEWVGFVG